MKIVIAALAAALLALPVAAQAQNSPSTTNKAQGFQGAQDGAAAPAPAPKKKMKSAAKQAGKAGSPSTANKAQGFQGAQQ